jgi:hypothetical protein
LKKYLFLIFALHLCCSSIFAQTVRTSAIMETLIADFIKNINNVPQLGTSEKVMSFFHKSFRNEVTIFDLGGKMQTQNRNYLSTQQTYNRYTQAGAKVEYKLQRFLKSYANDSVGYVVFEMEYQLMMNGAAYRKGEQTVTYQLEKINNQWQAMNGMTFIHYKEVNKGSCDCTLFNKNSEYVATLQVPDGDDYLTKYHTIKFKQITGAQREVMVDNVLYAWTIDSKSYITTPDKRTLTLKTRNEAEVVNAIMNDIYRAHCFNVVFAK